MRSMMIKPHVSSRIWRVKLLVAATWLLVAASPLPAFGRVELGRSNLDSPRIRHRDRYIQRWPRRWFYFNAPPDLVHLTDFADSDGGTFKSARMTLSYSYWWGSTHPRLHVANPNRYFASKPGYRRSVERIGPRSVEVFTCRVFDDRDGLTFYVGMFARNVVLPDYGDGGNWGQFELTVACRSLADRDEAFRIVRSLRFP